MPSRITGIETRESGERNDQSRIAMRALDRASSEDRRSGLLPSARRSESLSRAPAATTDGRKRTIQSPDPRGRHGRIEGVDVEDNARTEGQGPTQRPSQPP